MCNAKLLLTFLEQRLNRPCLTRKKQTNVLATLVRAVISQNCKDQTTASVVAALEQENLLVPEVFLQEPNNSLAIIKKSGCYTRKHATIKRLMSLNLQSVEDIKTLKLSGIGPKTLRVVLAQLTDEIQTIVDVNVLKAYCACVGFKGSAEKLRLKLETELGLENAARLAFLLWYQRKNYCKRINCFFNNFCTLCKDFYAPLLTLNQK